MMSQCTVPTVHDAKHRDSGEEYRLNVPNPFLIALPREGENEGLQVDNEASTGRSNAPLKGPPVYIMDDVSPSQETSMDTKTVPLRFVVMLALITQKFTRFFVGLLSMIKALFYVDSISSNNQVPEVSEAAKQEHILAEE